MSLAPQLYDFSGPKHPLFQVAVYQPDTKNTQQPTLEMKIFNKNPHFFPKRSHGHSCDRDRFL